MGVKRPGNPKFGMGIGEVNDTRVNTITRVFKAIIRKPCIFEFASHVTFRPFPNREPLNGIPAQPRWAGRGGDDASEPVSQGSRINPARLEIERKVACRTFPG